MRILSYSREVQPPRRWPGETIDVATNKHLNLTEQVAHEKQIRGLRSLTVFIQSIYYALLLPTSWCRRPSTVHSLRGPVVMMNVRQLARTLLDDKFNKNTVENLEKYVSCLRQTISSPPSLEHCNNILGDLPPNTSRSPQEVIPSNMLRIYILTHGEERCFLTHCCNLRSRATLGLCQRTRSASINDREYPLTISASSEKSTPAPIVIFAVRIRMISSRPWRSGGPM